MIKYSGGLVKDEKQANYVLLGFVALAIIISLFLFFGGSYSYEEKITPSFLPPVQETQIFGRNKIMLITNKTKQGFTLIELLVVIAIIGLLSSIVLASLNSARIKARDARRISDIRQIRTALEFYYDKYGRYVRSGECGASTPNTGWSNSVECLSGGRWLRDSSTNMAEFLPADPIDPINQNNWLRGAYYYFSQGYGNDSQWYMIVYALENFPNPFVESTDGVTAPDGYYFHYGGGSDGIITIGVGR